MLIKFSDDTQLRKIDICHMTQLGFKKTSASPACWSRSYRMKRNRAKWKLLPQDPQHQK